MCTRSWFKMADQQKQLRASYFFSLKIRHAFIKEYARIFRKKFWFNIEMIERSVRCSKNHMIIEFDWPKMLGQFNRKMNLNFHIKQLTDCLLNFASEAGEKSSLNCCRTDRIQYHVHWLFSQHIWYFFYCSIQ